MDKADETNNHDEHSKNAYSFRSEVSILKSIKKRIGQRVHKDAPKVPKAWYNSRINIIAPTPHPSPRAPSPKIRR